MQQLTFARWKPAHIPGAARWSLRRLLAQRSERISGTTAPVRAAPATTCDTAGAAATAPSDAAEDFEAFYQRHEREVFGYLWRVTGDEQTANDLTQEVFFRAWRTFEKLCGYERPEAWLFRVATNLALNERRHQRIAGPAIGLLGHERAPGDHAAQLAERSALRDALESLPTRQRAAFILRELYGHSCDEIAERHSASRAPPPR